LETARLTFVGDISFSGKNKNSQLPFVDNDILNLFNSSDAVIGNFESSVSSEDNLGLFQSSIASLSNLSQSGITHAFIANNHIYDYGEESFLNTIATLELNGIAPLGLNRYHGENRRVTPMNIKGVKIGLLCCGWTKVSQKDDDLGNGYWEYNEDEIISAIYEHKQHFDHLLLVFHKGKMFVEYPSDSDRKAYLKYLELGATAIIGHHPHVVQGIDSKNGKLIAYSIGNFYFDSEEGQVQSSFSKRKQDVGVVLTLELTKNVLMDFDITPIVREGKKVIQLSEREQKKFNKHLKKISSPTSHRLLNLFFYLGQYSRFVLPHFVKVWLSSNKNSK
jgi:poly-gamma-glutamate capsule biosynthesis protein CapA/YwtB (metallophosphatase superfamily)